MQAIGLFALGSFFGTLCGLTLRYLKQEDFKDVKKILSSIVSTVVAGGLVPFLKLISLDSNMIALYPLGLIIGLAWAYVHVVKDNLNPVILSVIHIAGLVLITSIALGILLSPGFRSLLPHT